MEIVLGVFMSVVVREAPFWNVFKCLKFPDTLSVGRVEV